MRMLILLLLFLPGIAVGQDRKLIKKLQTADFYIKLENPGAISVCGEESINFYISNRRIYIDSYSQHYDLRVVKRKAHWIAKDKEGKYYYIFGTTFEGNSTIIIDPYDVAKPVFILSTTDLCK